MFINRLQKWWHKWNSSKKSALEPVVHLDSVRTPVSREHPARHYLYTSLKKQGVEVIEGGTTESSSFDLYLPKHHIAVYCPESDHPIAIRKVRYNYLRKLAAQSENHLIVVDPRHFYKGYQSILTKMKQSAIE